MAGNLKKFVKSLFAEELVFSQEDRQPAFIVPQAASVPESASPTVATPAPSFNDAPPIPSPIGSSQQLVELPEARFESAFQFWQKRGWVPASVQDARFDASAATRLELLRRSRHWEQNSGYLQKILDLFENFTVGGSGLHLIPNSANEDFNEVARIWWREFCHRPARDNYLPMSHHQSLLARSWFVDGDIFVYKTYLPKTGRPAIQLIEAHRIETPGNMSSEEGKTIIDGVTIDSATLPIGYQVRVANIASPYTYGIGQPNSIRVQPANLTYNFVPAENMFHLFEPPRPGMTRGLPMAYAELNDLQDLYELQDLEMQKARDGARITTVISNKTGEADLSNSFRQRMSLQSQNAQGGATVKQVPQYYEVTMGGQTVYVCHGDAINQFKSDQPSAATQEYWNTLIGKVSMGCGLPRQLVVPYSIQGTALRCDIETAAAFFKARSSVVGHTMYEIYRWAMAWAIENDRRLKGAPKDWDQVVVRPPRSINVDIGRQSAALISELQAGIRTLQDVCSELGLDWREVLRQRAREWAYAANLATEFNVPIERIMELPRPAVPPAGSAPGAAQNAQALADQVLEMIEDSGMLNGSGANGHVNGNGRAYNNGLDHSRMSLKI